MKLENTLLNIELKKIKNTIPDREFSYFILNDFVNVYSDMRLDDVVSNLLGGIGGSEILNGKSIYIKDIWLFFLYQTFINVGRFNSTRFISETDLAEDMSPSLITIYTNLHKMEDRYIEMSNMWGADISIDNVNQKFIKAIYARALELLNDLSINSPIRNMTPEELHDLYPKCIPIIRKIILNRFLKSEAKELDLEKIDTKFAENFSSLLALEPEMLNNAIASLDGGNYQNVDLREVVNTAIPNIYQPNSNILTLLTSVEKNNIVNVLRKARDDIYLSYQKESEESPLYQEIQDKVDAYIWSCLNQFQDKNYLDSIQKLVSKNRRNSYNENSKEGNFLKLISLQTSYPLYNLKNGKVEPTDIFKDFFSKIVQNSISKINQGYEAIDNSATEKVFELRDIIDDLDYFVPLDSIAEFDKLTGNLTPIKQKILQTLKNFKSAGSIDGYLHQAYRTPPLFPKQGAHKLHGYGSVDHIAFKFSGTGVRLIVSEQTKPNKKGKYQIYIGDYHDTL